ncbi:hypothetical protein AC249_AIPGENE11508, partial [Exaiptasia diaphana]
MATGHIRCSMSDSIGKNLYAGPEINAGNRDKLALVTIDQHL